jgi:hypothetical protein
LSAANDNAQARQSWPRRHRESLSRLAVVGEMPTLSEIDLRARTAVKVFLDGIEPDETAILSRQKVLEHAG